MLTPEVLKALDVAPQRYTSTLGAAQAAYSGGLGDMGGFLSAELNFRERVLARFGGPTDGATGRPSNWVARLIAMHAADIYRTTLPGDIVKADGRPSFEGFLERFSVSFPDAERADKRELARSVWKGTYKGTPFAPVSDAIPQRGG